MDCLLSSDMCEVVPGVQMCTFQTLSKHFSCLVWTSDVGSDLLIVLDDTRESDNVKFWISGFEVLPEVFRRQNLTRLVDPHVPEHTGTGRKIISNNNNNNNNKTSHLF